MLSSLVHRRAFWMAVVGLIVQVGAAYGLDLSAEQLGGVALALVSAIAGVEFAADKKAERDALSEEEDDEE